MVSKKIVKDGNDMVIAGNFNCKEVSWEAMTTSGGENSWNIYIWRVLRTCNVKAS